MGGIYPLAGSEGIIPLAGGSRGKQSLDEGLGIAFLIGVWGRSPRRKISLVNVYCNFIVNLDRSL
jgi:hypothetical protein